MTERRILSGMMLTLLFIGMLTPAFKIQPVEAGGTIYIKADGGIEPPTANITTVDNITYTFTDNNYDEIVVERNNIVVDGAGYTIQGPGSGTGITLSGRSNVTIKNTIIKNWTQGIWAYVSSGITISNNKMINNGNFGIWTGYSNGNTISNNTVASNGWWGIVITLNSSGNTISNNTVTDNNNGIVTVLHSNNNTVSGNEVTLNWGIGISASNYSCYNTISGNTVTSNGGAGIVLPYYSSGNTVSNNTVASSDEWGILLLDHSGGNNITGNTVNSNGYAGIVTVLECHDNIIIDNRVWNNSFHGIHLRISSGNILRDNNMTGNKYDFGVWSDLNRVSDYVQDIDTSNTVDGKPIYYWVNQRDKEVPADAGHVTTVNCVNITVEDLNLTKNSVGVRFVNTTDSTIRNVTALNNTVGISLILSSGNTIIGSTIISLGYYHPWQDPYFGPPGWLPGYGIGLWNSSGNNMSDNTITNNDCGITLGNSSGNTMSDNTITNNNDYGVGLGNSSGNTMSDNTIANNDLGVGLEDSSNNTIYHNSFVNNTVQANVTSGCVNTWDDGYPSGGNYWSDYAGVDLYSGPNQDQPGSDVIGDTPYTIDANNTDNYPLMEPWQPPPPVIKIGVVGPKGLIQWDGLWEGAQMARDEINDAGGVNLGGTFCNIQLVDIDEHSVPVPNPTAGVTELLNALDAHPDMQFLIGGWSSECVFPMREACMDYAALHGRPIWFIVGAATDELIDDGPVKDNPYDDVRENYERYKYMFRVSPVNATTLLNALVAFLRDYVLPQKLAPIYGSPVKTYVVAENLAWCDGIVASLEGGALGTQAEIVGVARPSPLETDFTPIFDLVEGAEARLVVHVFSAAAGASYIVKYGTLQPNFTTVGINVESQLQEFYASVGGKCEYESFLASVGTGTPIIPGVTDKFWNDYEARWGFSPIYTSWGAYDAIMALNETLYGMPTLPSCTTLIPIIEQTDRTGLTGKFKYTEYHDVFCNELGPTWTQGYVRPLLVQWQDGEMEVVWPRDKPYSRKYKIPPWMYVLAETDFVTDGLVDIAELSVITGLWFETPPWYLLEADMNGDNFIDISDLTVLALDWGKNAKEIYGQWPLP